VSCSTGGNVLINVGPTAYGKIDPIYQERLLQMGSWLQINGEGIYGSNPWKHQKDKTNGNVW
jgi:alpha-L-fucosidase